MGLFDRFKKQAKDVVEEEIAVEEGSIEAELALIERRKLLEAIEKIKQTAPHPHPLGLKIFKPKSKRDGMIFKNNWSPIHFLSPGVKSKENGQKEQHRLNLVTWLIQN